jgi:hypothetical protein
LINIEVGREAVRLQKGMRRGIMKPYMGSQCLHLLVAPSNHKLKFMQLKKKILRFPLTKKK